MRKKIIKILDMKELDLNNVYKLIETETKKSTLKGLYKNEIELRAQIAILRHILYN